VRLCQAIVSQRELADDSIESRDFMYSQLVMKVVSQHGLAPFAICKAQTHNSGKQVIECSQLNE